MASAPSENPVSTFFDYGNIEWYRRFMLRLRYALPMSEYEVFANVVGKALRGDVPFPSVWEKSDVEAGRGAVQDLRKDGYTILGPLATPEEVADVHEYLKTKKVYDGWERVKGEFAVEDTPPDVHVAHYREPVIVNAPHLVHLANHPRIIARVSEYLGVAPTIQYYSMWWSLAGRPEPKDAQLFHVDRHCYRYVKLFIYLTDVDMENGPHVYVRGSNHHREAQAKLREIAARDPAAGERFTKMMGSIRKSDEDIIDFFGEENVVYLTGKAGDSMLVNTDGLHKGYLPKSRNRLIFQVLYTMLPTIKDPMRPAYRPNFLGEWKDRFGDILPEDQLRYMNRLVLKF